MERITFYLVDGRRVFSHPSTVESRISRIKDLLPDPADAELIEFMVPGIDNGYQFDEEQGQWYQKPMVEFKQGDVQNVLGKEGIESLQQLVDHQAARIIFIDDEKQIALVMGLQYILPVAPELFVPHYVVYSFAITEDVISGATKHVYGEPTGVQYFTVDDFSSAVINFIARIEQEDQAAWPEGFLQLDLTDYAENNFI